jgi:hypothetical protein
MRTRRIILLSVACLALPYFSTLCDNGAIFGGGVGGVIECAICVVIVSADVSEIFLILRRIQFDLNIAFVLSNRYSCFWVIVNEGEDVEQGN